MSPDIERAIEQLEAKIAELTSARDTLIETFDPPDSPRRRLVLARRASAAERARRRGEAQSPAKARPDSSQADPRARPERSEGAGPTVSGETIAVQGAVQGAVQSSGEGSAQGPFPSQVRSRSIQDAELDYANLGRRITRKDALAEFLREHGPSTRAEILHGLAIPPGSIAYVLNDKNRFVLVDGKWHNVPGQESVQHPASQGAGFEGQAGAEGSPTTAESGEGSVDKPKARTSEPEPIPEV